MLNNIVGVLGVGGEVATTSFDSIATINGTGSSGTITLSSIPSTYKHLQLRMIFKGTNTSGGYPTGMRWWLNNDTTNANYYYHSIEGNGSAVTARATSGLQSYFSPSIGSSTGLTNIYAVAIVDILDYANTNKNKTLRVLTGCDTNGAGSIIFSSGLWISTNAIDRIDIIQDATFGGNFTTASQIALYGIKA